MNLSLLLGGYVDLQSCVRKEEYVIQRDRLRKTVGGDAMPTM